MRRGRWAAVLALAFLTAGFTGLGVWQVQRLAWKTALIRQVDARLAAAPVPAPGPDGWSAISPDADADAYRRVTVTGRFRNDRETLVQAVTALGAGSWVLTPLETDRGFTVLVNRGFVPPERRDPAQRGAPAPEGVQTVTGLLRLTEPHGAFLRANEPAVDRWRSRDVAAIAQRRGLGRTAPYFIDAAAGPDRDGWPRAGLTVVRFSNSHLVYALTWFGLALMSVAGAVIVLRRKGREDR